MPFPLIDWTDANLRWVAVGAALLGTAAGTLGAFAFLRGRSLMGDALAHAALPGVCLAYLLAEWLRGLGWGVTSSKSLPLLLLGAALAGVLAAWCIAAVARNSRVKEDAAQAIVLSVFFGGGVVLLTRIQHSGAGNQSGLDKFLFGQAASMVGSDLTLLASVAAILCVLCAAFYKEFKLLCFDADFGRGIGFPMQRLDAVLLAMIVASVVIGLQAVGVVLISALLIIPPASARFWTESLGKMVPLSAAIGGLSGALGALLSAVAPRMPTGPLIVLAATGVFLFSLFLAPGRGAVARAWRQRQLARRVAQENVLRDLARLNSAPGQDQEKSGGVTEAELAAHRRWRPLALRGALRRLEKTGHIQPAAAGWSLTAAGLEAAAQVERRHALWRLFLMHETSLGVQNVDREADSVEHFLTADAVAQLELHLAQEARQ